MIRIQQLTKAYEHGGTRTVVLDRLDFEVDSGEIAAVVGPSGAGKSTLAACVNLLEHPTSGSVLVDGEDLTALSEAGLRVARRRIGTIFQSDGLFSRRTAAQNVALPLEYLGVTAAESKARVAELLDRVGLADRATHYPHQLSGGQRQRVGIARALALRPRILLSDEATSGLDPDSTRSILGLLRQLRDELDLSILLITHEMDVVRQVADTVGRLEGGRFTESGRVVDLLQDPVSRLGQDLQPRREAQPAAAGEVHLAVAYGSSAVPTDWLARLGDDLGSPVGLLGASIEVVGGATVGHATVGIREADLRRARDALLRLGLTPRDGAPAVGVDAVVADADLERVA
ncbi:Methionine import ATP-binding protein MetN [Frondihabitans sp. 762G35]|uniref:methionine ABC transporter ATP-binding protein n=1 Tax=Frondihabitans sp. 762G35 TaxID=1446794 RepID=UPI000D223965|nr:ATP-binding cassette domain-containing protein [Frondihabitans sp. 762G35]ARC56987.1 Methionine import ATP-binding protein MetN [Frondihabitans sp. 762G35]